MFHWFDIIDDDDERGVLEIGDHLELVVLDDGCVWLWRDEEGRILQLAEVGTA